MGMVEREPQHLTVCPIAPRTSAAPPLPAQPPYVPVAVMSVSYDNTARVEAP